MPIHAQSWYTGVGAISAPALGISDAAVDRAAVAVSHEERS